MAWRCQKGDVFLPSRKRTIQLLTHTSKNFNVKLPPANCTNPSCASFWILGRTREAMKRNSIAMLRLEQRGIQQKFTIVAREAEEILFVTSQNNTFVRTACTSLQVVLQQRRLRDAAGAAQVRNKGLYS